MVDVLAKLAGSSEYILSVVSSAAFKKLSADEVCKILDNFKDDDVTLTSTASMASPGNVTFYAVLLWVKGIHPFVCNDDPAAVLKILGDLRDEIQSSDLIVTDEVEREALGKLIQKTFSFIEATMCISCERVGWETLECSDIMDSVRSDRVCTQYESGSNELQVLQAVLLWLRCVPSLHEMICSCDLLPNLSCIFGFLRHLIMIMCLQADENLQVIRAVVVFLRCRCEC